MRPRPGPIAQTLATRASSLERVGLESGPLAPWLVPGLRALPVVCLDARHARAALSVQINKSDANDADGLAQIVPHGMVSRGRGEERGCSSRARELGGA